MQFRIMVKLSYVDWFRIIDLGFYVSEIFYRGKDSLDSFRNLLNVQALNIVKNVDIYVRYITERTSINHDV